MPELVAIDLPPDAEHRAIRAVQRLTKYEAACFWCGYGYSRYSRKAENEHLADCPEAPEELRENARERLLLGDDDTGESGKEQDGDAETR